jgi:hypothetical protein
MRTLESFGAVRYPRLMEIPLGLRRTRPGGLVYAIPPWYRVFMAALAVIVATSIFAVPKGPGIFAWVILALVALGGLYEESWVFDSTKQRITHRAGLLVAARSIRIPFDEVERFRLVPHVRGTIPGSEDERVQNAAALAAGRDDDYSRKRSRFKRPYMSLIFECSDGSRYLIDRMNARRAPRLRRDATSIASLCDRPLVEG